MEVEEETHACMFVYPGPGATLYDGEMYAEGTYDV